MHRYLFTYYSGIVSPTRTKLVFNLPLKTSEPIGAVRILVAVANALGEFVHANDVADMHEWQFCNPSTPTTARVTTRLCTYATHQPRAVVRMCNHTRAALLGAGANKLQNIHPISFFKMVPNIRLAGAGCKMQTTSRNQHTEV
jgi:hypothetical protein